MIEGQYFDRPQPGWEMLTRGVYVDKEKTIHFFPSEFLVANGYADTPHNRAMVEQSMRDAVREKYGSVPMFDIYPPK